MRCVGHVARMIIENSREHLGDPVVDEMRLLK
jgi:hypothetical protein